MPDPKLIYLVTEGWYFYSHRLPMVRAAQRAGFDVSVITNEGQHRALIESEGVRVIPLSLERRSLNPFKALKHIVQITRIYQKEKPDMVHHIAMKPVLYGSIAAWIAKVPRVINAFAGLGYVFNSQALLARALRPFLLLMFRFLLKRDGSSLLLQNKDDLALLKSHKLVPKGNSIVIRGSGVDLNTYTAHPFNEPAPDFICVFAGRMIDIKGLPTLQDAFALLAETMPHVTLWLCGQPDPDNPTSWNEARLRQWERNNPHVIYKGQCRDMAKIWAQAHLAVQPSYGGEGVPKSLLEAAASGRAIIATDVPGCRELVNNEQDGGKNGLLVPPQNAAALAEALQTLANDPDLCKKMGENSRTMVETDLSADSVSAQTEHFYKRCFEKQTVNTKE